jgi:hypothetical protein
MIGTVMEEPHFNQEVFWNTIKAQIHQYGLEEIPGTIPLSTPALVISRLNAPELVTAHSFSCPKYSLAFFNFLWFGETIIHFMTYR